MFHTIVIVGARLSAACGGADDGDSKEVTSPHPSQPDGGAKADADAGPAPNAHEETGWAPTK